MLDFHGESAVGSMAGPRGFCFRRRCLSPLEGAILDSNLAGATAWIVHWGELRYASNKTDTATLRGYQRRNNITLMVSSCSPRLASPHGVEALHVVLSLHACLLPRARFQHTMERYPTEMNLLAEYGGIPTRAPVQHPATTLNRRRNGAAGGFGR